MSGPVALVAVDVGNTAVKLSIEPLAPSEGASFKLVHAFKLDRANWPAAIVQWAQSTAAASKLSLEQSHWLISSVQRRAAEKLRKQIAQSIPSTTLQQITHHDVPMKMRIDAPGSLGIDRLLSAFAAQNRFKTPLVIVDAGSAVTVDYVNASDEFCGGAILPGLNLQTNALATGTDALPPIDWTDTPSLRIPGKNTSEAIQLGVLTSVTAAIDRLVQAYENETQQGDEVTVVLCGGDAPVISGWVQHTHTVQPELVLEGLCDLVRPPK
ncbi:Type III pantothenate kinase [Planctomycetes bacterium CA13]|uniref:Type III pantothenate kinase n=1 Tax=Novipirellula herctigrandis TaxID=2527986 RepID=A0A5C5YZS3_9BACT|nr:Type III pantothenate kinase [Planctomycetes bacterium CA13]